MPRKSNKPAENNDPVPNIKEDAPETTRDIMTRHLLNKDDVITDEEFRNLKIEGQEEAQDAKSLDFLADKDRPKDEDKDPENLTPWDVIK